MSDPSIVVVIPARMASSRFPGKPLVEIHGLPMIEHVRRRALMAEGVNAVVVATCDDSIFDAVTRAGGHAVMTANTHERCTDRVEEAMRSLDADIVVIVQGDEPLLLPDAVTKVAEPLLADETLPCTSLLSPLEGDADFQNPNIVKAVCDLHGDVMFFSRAPVPHFRHQGPCPVYRQTGILAFQASFLRTYGVLPQTPFERAESVDLLRLLEHRYRVRGVCLKYSTVGVDRPEDVAVVERLMQEDPLQRSLYERSLGR